MGFDLAHFIGFELAIDVDRVGPLRQADIAHRETSRVFMRFRRGLRPVAMALASAAASLLAP